MERKYDLEERLIRFAAIVIDIAEGLPKTIAGTHLCGQLIRAGTAPCLHYGEAQGAESKNDFVHKMKLSLKELRESLNCLRLIHLKNWNPDPTLLLYCIDENNQLVAIFVKSIETVMKKAEGATSGRQRSH